MPYHSVALATPQGSAIKLSQCRQFDTYVVELALLRAQTGFDVAQALAVCQLGEDQAQKLIEAGERLDLVVAVVALNTPTESVQRQVIDHLRENKFACIHNPESSVHESVGEGLAKGQ